jgi:hypothetical protein
MATTFLLGAFIFLLKLKASEFKCKRFWTLYVLCIGLGPLCFSRGIVTGLVVSLAGFFPLFKISKVNRILVIVLSCLPCLIVGGVIFKFSSGNHHHFIDKLPEIIAFSSNFFALNPFLRLFDFWSHNLTFIFLGFLVKIFLYWFAFAKGTENQKLIVLLIVLFDVFNALIVGLGRFHTGLEASVSSRYQYQPMLSVAISLAILLQNMLFEFYSSRWQLQAVGFVLTIFLGLFLLMEWKSDLRGFTRTRGEDNRYIILHDNSPPQFGVAGIPFLKTKTARKLVKKYGLH